MILFDTQYNYIPKENSRRHYTLFGQIGPARPIPSKYKYNIIFNTLLILM